MTYQLVSIGELTKIRTGKLDANAASADGRYPFFTCSKKPLKIDNYAYDCDAILIAGNGDLNVKHFKGKFEAYQRTYIIEVVQHEKLDSRYLFHFMNKYVEKLRALSIGGVIKYIKLGMLTEAKIPLPPLPEQRRIAAILDKADAIRRKRQQAIRLTEEFLRSVFLDMFGDPVLNPKGWEVKKMGDLLEFLTSGSRGWAKYYKEQGRPFLRIQNVGKNEILLDDLAYVVPPESAEAKRTKVKAGDVLLSITADLGRTGVVPDNLGEAHINQHLALIRLNQGVPLYISAFLASDGGQRQFAKSDKGGVKAGLNFDDIRSIKFLFPSLSEQEKWAFFYKRQQAHIGTLRTYQGQVEGLFNSLVQRAFRGEL